MKNVSCFMTVDGEFINKLIIVRDVSNSLINMIEVYNEIDYKLEDDSEYSEFPIEFEGFWSYSEEYGWFFFNNEEEEISFDNWITYYNISLTWNIYKEDLYVLSCLLEEKKQRAFLIQQAEELATEKQEVIRVATNKKAEMIALATKLIVDNNVYPTQWKAFFDMIDAKWQEATVIRGEIKKEYVKGSSYTSSDGMGSRSSGGHLIIQLNTIILNNGEKIDSSIYGSTVTSKQEEVDLINHYKSIDCNDSNLMSNYHSDWGQHPNNFNYYITNNYEDIINHYNSSSEQFIPSFYKKKSNCNAWAKFITEALNIDLSSYDWKKDQYIASYIDEYQQTVYFYIDIVNAYNLELINIEINKCLLKNAAIRQVEENKKEHKKQQANKAKLELEAKFKQYQYAIDAAKAAGLELIEVSNNLPKVKGIFNLKDYGGKKGCENPYIDWLINDPQGAKYLKIVSKPIIKKKY